MQVNNVCSSFNGAVFKSKNTELEKSKNNVKSDDNSDKLKTGLICLAVLGSVLAGNAVIKKKNNNVGILGIIEKKITADKPDPLLQKIGNNRDSEAVKTYKKFQAEKKLDSLKKRVVNGEFDKKNKEVFQHLIENEKKLERTARGII